MDEGRIIITGFNSCFNNDCYRFVGEIPSHVISNAHLHLRTLSECKLHMAVWHHDLHGSPFRSDYIDATIIDLLIDSGFRLSLHGHNHKLGATPYSLFLSENHTMAVVSGGSLCAGPKMLPTGHNRSYNIIEIEKDYNSATLHVREMLSYGVFGPSRVAKWGGHSYKRIKWSK